MLKVCIIGSRSRLAEMYRRGVFCAEAKDINEVADRIRTLSENGYSSFYITDEYYGALSSYLIERGGNRRHNIKLFPSAQSGDIGSVREILMCCA